MPSFRRLEYQLLTLIGLSVLCGLSIMVWFYAERQKSSILAQNEKTLHRVTDTIHETLQGVMLTGNAGMARTVFAHLQHIDSIDDIRILRLNGEEAFHDGRTIEAVNRQLGTQEFIPRDASGIRSVLAPDNPHLRRAVQTAAISTYYETGADGETLFTLLAPIPNATQCHKCHDQGNPLRGLIKVTNSLAGAEAEIAATRRQAGLLLAVTLVAILLLTSVLLRRAVIHPIRRVTQAMQRAAHGDLTQQLAQVGADEINSMATSFNSMISRLLHSYNGLQSEHDKLNTIILSAREGMVVTDRDGAIVLVNPAAERLLGKDMNEIEKRGLLQLLDAPEAMQRRLLDAESGNSRQETVEFNGRQLDVHASAIRSVDDEVIGSAVMLRDITAQKQLEQDLLRLSSTDALTGLFNRRHLDRVLALEFGRAQRYGLDLTVMMFDVDHFKRFNDTHGHNLGDAMLRKIAEVTQATVRRIDIPCRYGGEEFLIILPATQMAGARLLAERLRESVAAARVDELYVTISVGLAALPDERVDSVQDLVALVDAALYRAKNAGRNRVEIA